MYLAHMSAAGPRAVEPGADGRRLLDAPTSSRPGPNKGNSISAFAVGIADKTLNQPMYVSPKGLAITGGSSASEPTSPALRQQAATEGGVQQSNVPPSVP